MEEGNLLGPDQVMWSDSKSHQLFWNAGSSSIQGQNKEWLFIDAKYHTIQSGTPQVAEMVHKKFVEWINVIS